MKSDRADVGIITQISKEDLNKNKILRHHLPFRIRKEKCWDGVLQLIDYRMSLLSLMKTVVAEDREYFWRNLSTNDQIRTRNL